RARLNTPVSSSNSATDAAEVALRHEVLACTVATSPDPADRASVANRASHNIAPTHVGPDESRQTDLKVLPHAHWIEVLADEDELRALGSRAPAAERGIVHEHVHALNDNRLAHRFDA